MNRPFSLTTPHGVLPGALERPDQPRGLVLAAHTQRAIRHNIVAASLAAAGFAILSMDLLTEQEAHFADAAHNIARLSQRLLDILDRVRADGDTEGLPLAIFATGEMTPAAVRVAAQRDLQVRALVCHGGLIDGAGRQALELLKAPLLMLLDAGQDNAKAAFQRARPYLSTVCEERMLAPGEDASPHIGAWLILNLNP